MLITDDLLTNAIRDTQAYKDYKKEFESVDVPTNQPGPVEYTHGTNRTPRATMTPNPNDVVQKKKRKGTPAAGETSSPMKSLKIRFKHHKPSTTTPPPPSDDQECDEIHEATLLSLSIAKIEDIEKMVDEDEESTANEFVDTVLLEKEDSDDRLEPGSHKEKLENIDDDVEKKYDKKDDDDDQTDHALIITRRTGSLEIRTEKMQCNTPKNIQRSGIPHGVLLHNTQR
ncbi:hypothetical protein Tco_1333997 [Tanacetum coccineum]